MPRGEAAERREALATPLYSGGPPALGDADRAQRLHQQHVQPVAHVRLGSGRGAPAAPGVCPASSAT